MNSTSLLKIVFSCIFITCLITVEGKYQYLKYMGSIEENFSSWDSNQSYPGYIFEARFYSSFTSLDNASTSGTSVGYIKRDENNVYSQSGSGFELFPLIQGNHPTKFSLYTHLRYDANNNLFIFKINYFTCLDNAVRYRDAQATDAEKRFTSIWLPTGVYSPDHLKKTNSLAYPYVNFPYPIVQLQYAYFTSNEVSLSNIIINNSNFNTWRTAANFETGITATINCSDYSNTDILIPIQLIKDNSSVCTYLPQTQSSQESNSYICNQTANPLYDTQTSCQNNLYVIGICYLNDSANHINYTGNIKLADGSTINSQTTYDFVPHYAYILRNLNMSGAQ